jgi:hypothetical protein
MRRPFLLLLLCCLWALPLQAATGRVIKVLPHFLDRQGRHTLSPSLYERDAYQFQLRQHPEQRSGMRFDVQWKASGGVYSPLKLRVELRGTANGNLPSETTLELPVKSHGWFGHWVSLPLTGAQYTKIGEVTAWRVTLWEGDQLLSSQNSFLW